MTMYTYPRRGEVWLASLDPSIGHEIQKTRPVVIVSAELYNQHNWVILVVPITSHVDAEYDQVRITPPNGGLTTESVTLPDQLRSIDRERLVKKLGMLDQITIQKINTSLRIVLDLL